MFITCRNAWTLRSSGYTSWFGRHACERSFTKYPFGALILIRITKKSGGAALEKFDSRLSPCLLSNIDLNPGCTWNKTYTIVSLEKLLSNQRSGFVAVRRVCDVVFPENVTFPLRQRLALNGAMLDSACPASLLNVSEQGGFTPTLEEAYGDDDERDTFDGEQAEN